MAKQLVNPFERHVEKAVLAVAVLALLYVSARFVVTSPNTADLGGEMVTPGNIDRRIVEAAQTARSRIQSARAQDIEMPEPLYPQFEAKLDPLDAIQLALDLPPAAPLQPPVPLVDPPEGPRRTELVRVMPLRDVATTSGRSTFQLTDTGRLVVTNWVTVSAVFDVATQMKEQREKYSSLYQEVIFGPPEMQRRRLNPDGTWSAWDFVEPWPPIAVKLPEEPEITLVTVDDKTLAAEGVDDAVERFVEAINRPLFQLDILRPMMPEQINGDEWTFPILTSRRDVLMMDDQYMFPNEPPAKDPLDRYRPEVVREASAQQLTPSEKITQQLAEAKANLAQAKKNLVENDALRAYNTAFDVKQNPDASAAQKREADQLMKEADLALADIQRKILFGQAPQPGGPAPAAGQGAVRQPLPTQQLWTIDAGPDRVRDGMTYEYRMRPVIFNRLAGQPEKFQDPEDAKVVWISGEWTEPVEVTIPEYTRFFVTSDDPRENTVKVEFYRWFEGLWLDSGRVPVREGERLRTAERKPVPKLDDPSVLQRPLVEFSADAMVLDIDFERLYRERRRGASSTGVRFGDPEGETAVVLVDEEGRLQERFVLTEKDNAERKLLGDKVFKPGR